MIRSSAAALAMAVMAMPIAAPLHAEDARLVEVTYDEANVFRIEGRPKVQATIRFAEDEAIENVAVGDSNAWQITPNKRANLLFVKPLEERAKTNMTVVTNKRTYLFDLVASPTAKPLYVMSFTYPKEEAAKAAAQLAQARQQTTPIEDAAASDDLAVLDPAELNFAWNKTGDAGLLPENVFDDGEAVFLTWPEGRTVPAILITDSKGTEGPVNFSVRGNTIVVDGVPRQIVLRSGKDMATMVNTGPERPRSQAPSQARADTALAQQDRR
ncbi:TrbG/VirB9 family P-type conjugative transfer protein [Qipengyuania sp.]|uniref:TrbG/VirB9 family P-type conjugative transfer protein n=1 Tax=Qipengyuania sp. TaxID=2004515 RepID=UPI0035C7A46D